jgi:hypothetical protein
MALEGGSATPKGQNGVAFGLGVTEPPPWPMGVVRPPKGRKPNFLFFYFLFFFTLALESGRTTPKTGVGGKKIKVLNHMSVKYLTLHYK